MYEIIHEFKQIPKFNKLEKKDDFNKNTFFSFNMCEFPGSFIKCIDYYIKTKRSNINYDWMANSLFSTDDSIIGDYYNMYKNNKNKWLFGEDKTGDITKIKNMDDI